MLAIAVGGVLVSALVGVVLGPRGRRDPVLFAGAIIAVACALAGAGGLLFDGLREGGALVLAVFLAYRLRPRWRAARATT